VGHRGGGGSWGLSGHSLSEQRCSTGRACMVLAGQSSGGERHATRLSDERRRVAEVERAEGTGRGSELAVAERPA
jgi:hypothetical protein